QLPRALRRRCAASLKGSFPKLIASCRPLSRPAGQCLSHFRLGCRRRVQFARDLLKDSAQYLDRYLIELAHEPRSTIDLRQLDHRTWTVYRSLRNIGFKFAGESDFSFLLRYRSDRVGGWVENAHLIAHATEIDQAAVDQ